MKQGLFFLIIFFGSMPIFSCPLPNSLFTKMEGTWVGAGLKTSVTTEIIKHLNVDSKSEIKENVLFSTNHFKEIDSQTNEVIRSYSREYWIRPTTICKDEKRIYEFGNSKVLDENVTMTGEFDGLNLITHQQLSSHLIYSLKTTFSSTYTITEGQFLVDDQLIQNDVTIYQFIPIKFK